jgi:hypothetical protein
MQTNIIDKRSIVDNPSLSICLYYVRTRKNNKIWVKVEHTRAIYQKIEHYYNNNSNDDEATIDINSHTHTRIEMFIEYEWVQRHVIIIIGIIINPWHNLIHCIIIYVVDQNINIISIWCKFSFTKMNCLFLFLLNGYVFYALLLWKKSDPRVYVYLSIVFIDDDFNQALIQIFVFYYSNIMIYFNLNVEKKNLLNTISEKKEWSK